MGKNLTRRQFITRSMGVAGLLAALSSPFMPFLNKVKAVDSPANKESVKEKVRAWCMVIDLKKCDGCTGLGIPPQCTQACILGHYVPKGMRWIQVFESKLPGDGSFFMPAPCYHCENAPCVNVCPVGATYHNKDGLVLIDQRRCIGCRFCIAACPYNRRFFNWGTPQLPPEAAFAEYSPESQVPAIKGTVMKCDFCPDMMRGGKLPNCVTACPRKVLYMGDLNEDFASNGVEVVKLSKFLSANDAYQHKEDLGTQPRVWYLPGHGQLSGMKPDNHPKLYENTWPWGDRDYNRQPGVWPWGDTDSWTWEAQVDES